MRTCFFPPFPFSWPALHLDKRMSIMILELAPQRKRCSAPRTEQVPHPLRATIHTCTELGIYRSEPLSDRSFSWSCVPPLSAFPFFCFSCVREAVDQLAETGIDMEDDDGAAVSARVSVQLRAPSSTSQRMHCSRACASRAPAVPYF